MIDVSHHKCYYSLKKKTEIDYNNDTFSSIGVPLKVIIHAFRKLELVWFSVMYGEFNDNVTILGVPEFQAQEMPKESYSDNSPIKTLYALDKKIEEYILSPQLQERFSISIPVTKKPIEFEDVYQISIHDDCFSVVKPVDDTLLQRLLKSVLKQHSYYLGFEVDWSSVFSTLMVKLVQYGHLNIQSKTKPNIISFFHEKRPTTLVKTRHREKIIISFKNGKAVVE